jgi:hypothetical protein
MTPTDGAPKGPILSLPKKPPQRTIRYVEDGTIPLPDVVAYLDKGTNRKGSNFYKPDAGFFHRHVVGTLGQKKVDTLFDVLYEKLGQKMLH